MILDILKGEKREGGKVGCRKGMILGPRRILIGPGRRLIINIRVILIGIGSRKIRETSKEGIGQIINPDRIEMVDGNPIDNTETMTVVNPDNIGANTDKETTIAINVTNAINVIVSLVKRNLVIQQVKWHLPKLKKTKNIDEILSYIFSFTYKLLFPYDILINSKTIKTN